MTPTRDDGVLGALRRDRVARAGLGAIAALVAVALAAPLLALDQPLVLATPDGIACPFFPALVNRLLFENAIDLLFNLALLAAPLYAVAWRLARRRGLRPAHVALALAAFHGAVFAACLPARVAGRPNPLHVEAPIPDARAEIAVREARGERVLAVFPLRPFSYRATDPARSVRPPDRTHWLGTDKEGRDVFARMVYGTRISLAVGVVAVSLYVAIGVVLGALAGWFGGRVDLVISRAIEVMICLPTFFLILALVALVQERSIFHVMAIIGVTSWTGVARLVRAEFLRQRDLDYVQAAVALGVSTRRILFVHMLPNALGPVLVSATFGVASAILVESSLAFLGLGDVSVASWGETLNAGRLEGKAWLVLVPGFAIFFVVSAFNLVGEGLRDALDPKLRS